MSKPAWRKKTADYCRSRLVVELLAAMGGPVQYVESDRQPKALELAVQLIRLVDGHLRILISMQQKQWRVRPVDMRDWACQHRQSPLFLGLATEQELQGRFSDAEPPRRGLVQNRQQVARSEVRNDCLHLRRLGKMRADKSFKFRSAVCYPDQSC